MFQARNGAQIFGLPGKRSMAVLAVAPENPESRRDVTGRLPELLELYARNHFVEGSTPATITFYRKEVGLFLKFQGHSMVPGDVSPSLRVTGDPMWKRSVTSKKLILIFGVETEAARSMTIYRWTGGSCWALEPTQTPATPVRLFPSITRLDGLVRESRICHRPALHRISKFRLDRT